MPRSLCILGVFALFVAFVFLFITTISLPYLSTMDITRTRFRGSDVLVPGSSSSGVSEIRFGIWTYCYDLPFYFSTTCGKTGYAYSVYIQTSSGNYATIGRNWTRGLAVHPVATAVTFIALLFSFSAHLTLLLIASILAFLAAALALIAFAIDIALYANVRYEVRKLDSGDNTFTGPGFWLTFISIILLLLAGFTGCFGRPRENRNNRRTKRSFYELGRFRRNRDVV